MGIKTPLLDQVIVWNERSLRRTLQSYGRFGEDPLGIGGGRGAGSM